MISAVLLSLSLEKLRSPEQLVIISDKYMRYPMRTFANTLANSLRIKYFNTSSYIDDVSCIDEEDLTAEMSGL